MPEQNFNVNSQLEYGFQLIDYNSRRNKVKSALESGKISEDRYNEYLMKFNDEERIQQTKIDNYKNAIEGYSDKDKMKYNFYNLLVSGKWDDASNFYSPNKNGFFRANAPFSDPSGQADSTYYPDGFGEIVKNYNELFTVNGQTQDSKTINFNEWYFDALEKYTNNNGIDLTKYGIYVDKSNRTVTLPHDENAFMILAKSINSITKEYPIKTIFHNVGDGGYLDKAGDALIEFENRHNRLISKYQNPVVDEVPVHSSLDYIDTFAFVENGQIKTANGLGSFQEMQAYMDRVNLGIKAGETKFNKQEIQNTFYNQLVGTNAANFPVWTINGNEFKRKEFEGGEFEPNTNDTQRNQIKEDIAYAMQNQPNAIMIRPAEDGENYGHVIYIPARENKDGGKQVHPGYTVFVPNFFEKEAIAAYKNDLGVVARDEIKTMEGYHMPKFKKSVRLQGSNSQGTYQIGSDFNGNYVYFYNNSNGKQFNLNQIFGSPQAAKAALWQVITAQNKLNTYTNLGTITEDWFDSLMTEYNNASGATTQEILSILGEQSVDETRRNIRSAYKNKFKK